MIFSIMVKQSGGIQETKTSEKRPKTLFSDLKIYLIVRGGWLSIILKSICSIFCVRIAGKQNRLTGMVPVYILPSSYWKEETLLDMK
ncbi:MAG TPA: hypothetical protein DHW17_01945 [Nitrospina sp.]|jgi:hypothetical protein|nr:hypothetical protein [Nitrospina sp.]